MTTKSAKSAKSEQNHVSLDVFDLIRVYFALQTDIDNRVDMAKRHPDIAHMIMEPNEHSLHIMNKINKVHKMFVCQPRSPNSEPHD